MSVILDTKYGGIRINENDIFYGRFFVDADGMTVGRDTVRFGGIEFSNGVSTTDDSGTELASIEMPDFSTMNISVIVVARRTGGASGADEDGLAYTMTGAFKSVAGTATQIGSTVVVADIKDQLSWDVQFVTIAKDVKIYVAGATGNDIDWVVYYKKYLVTQLT